MKVKSRDTARQWTTHSSNKHEPPPPVLSTALKTKATANQIADEGLIFRMCNELSKLNNKHQTAQFKNGQNC